MIRFALITMLCAAAACTPQRDRQSSPESAAVKPEPTEGRATDARAKERRRMVRSQIRSRGVVNADVLAAMEKVPRHSFVPSDLQKSAYADNPLPIGHRQTISQPYIVALTTELVEPAKRKKALDIGTGSGYQAAVLAELVDHVYSIEIICELADTARDRLAGMGYANITVRCGDGYRGWSEHAPFDIITVAAAPAEVPRPLLEQLAVGGRMVIPVGRGAQDLILLEKRSDGSIRRESIIPVRFVPMTGTAEEL